MEGWGVEHEVNAASSRTPLDRSLLPPAHRSAQILEPSMRTRLALMALAAALSTACGEGPLVPTTGAIRVALTTTGADVDPDGYTVQVDAGTAQALAVNGTIRFEGLQGGSHAVTLAGAATNCPVAADNPRTVSVTTGAVKRDTARTTFQVTCVATTAVIEVAAATSGIDLDPNGYALQIDGGSLRLLLGAGTVTVDGLAGGDHSVVLSGAAGNCTVAGDNPRTLHVITGGAARDTARTTFQVTCVALTGSIQVTAATSGVDVAPNGYTVLIDVGSLAPLPLNVATTIGGLTAGDHSVRLVGAPGNCTIAGENPRAVQVTAGGTTRDTARTAFAVTCVHVEKIAFQRGRAVQDNPTINVAYADGSNTVSFAPGTGPTWSPDGTKLAFAALSCYDYYYYYCY